MCDKTTMGAIAVIVLASTVVLCVLFSILSIVFGGFAKNASNKCPELDSDAKTATKWAHVCTWCAVFFGLMASISGFILARKSKESYTATSLPPQVAATSVNSGGTDQT